MDLRCLKCNYPILPDDKICPDCGAEIPQVLRLAKTSVILAIIGFFTTCFGIGILFDLAAVICGIKALKKIKESNGAVVGKDRAKIGIIFGSIMIIITGLIISFAISNFPAAQDHARVGKVREDQVTISIALASYYNDHNSYPLPDYDSTGRPIVPHILTTPISYWILSKDSIDTTLPGAFQDSFSQRGKEYYGYGVDTDKGYIIVSYGPDKVDGNSGAPGGSKMPYMKAWSDEALGFNLQASPLTYDPSNGIYSAGDIWRRGP